MIERLMLLDIVLDDRDVLWLGTESDKACVSLKGDVACRLSTKVRRTW
jgi:hypothetical protein